MQKNFSTLNELKTYLQSLAKTHNLYILGASTNGLRLGRYLTACNIKWKSYLDNNRNGMLAEKEIFNPQKVAFSKDDFVLIAIKSNSDRDAIYNQLIELGLSDKQILPIYYDKIWYEFLTSQQFTQYLSRYTGLIKKFKDIYKNKRCFIIGNGPSLKLCDLEKLDNEYSFACNEIFNVYNQTEWRPTYYVCIDIQKQALIFNDPGKMKLVSLNSKACFFNIWSTVTLSYHNNNDLLNLYFLNIVSPALLFSALQKICYEDSIPSIYSRYADEVEFFSTDCSKIICDCGSVSFTMLQLAAYMGFKEIFLLGIDNSYASIGDKSNSKDHSVILDDKTMNSNGILIDIKKVNEMYIDFCNLGYYATKQYADALGIKIYNATRGGKLEIFPRVIMEDLF